MKNENLLNEKLIDGLYEACLREACFNEEDRKRKGEAIVSVAGKMFEKVKEESDENEKNTNNTQTVVVKTEKKTEIAKRVSYEQKEIVEKIEKNINVLSSTPKEGLDSDNRDRDNSKKTNKCS